MTNDQGAIVRKVFAQYPGMRPVIEGDMVVPMLGASRGAPVSVAHGVASGATIQAELGRSCRDLKANG